MMPNFAGRLLGGRYRLTMQLGDTSSGVAYAADDERDRAPVTVTLMWASTLADVPDRATLAALRHPRVARFLGAGVVDGQVWFAREGLPDKFLLDEINTNAISTGRALSLAGAVCEGVAALHAVGLVHGAVYPQHVYVGHPTSPRDLAVDDVKIVDPQLPGVGAPPVSPASDIEQCVSLLVRLLEGRTPGPVAELTQRTWASAAALSAACAEALRGLDARDRDGIPTRQPPPPMPTDIPMPTNWSPPPPRPPFVYGPAGTTPANATPTPTPAAPTPPRRPMIAAAVALAAAAAAALGWWWLRR